MDVTETLQARIHTLELELNRIAGMAEQGAKMCKSDMDKRGLLAILRTAEAALEPAPMTNIGTPDLTDDELEIAKAEMDAFYGQVDDEPDYEAYRAAQEKAHWDALEAQEDENKLQAYFDEHGVEPGGTCPDCGRTDAGCVCTHEATYKVRWHTSVGVGATYYEGTETVTAESDDEAERLAQFNVHRRAFQDWPQSHIVIKSVERQ